MQVDLYSGRKIMAVVVHCYRQCCIFLSCEGIFTARYVLLSCVCPSVRPSMNHKPVFLLFDYLLKHYA